MPPDFHFCPPPPIYFLPHGIFLGGKSCFFWPENVEICDFRQKKPSHFGKFFFFFLRSPGFGRKICDLGQNWRSRAFGWKKTLKFRPEKAFGNRQKPLPPRSREAGDALEKNCKSHAKY